MMNQHNTWHVESTSAEMTEQLAEKIGQVLKGGEVIELTSDLGGGKTTFVRGLVRGLGSDDKVASPTFTISKLYVAGDLEVHHFDFYRLQEPGLIADQLAEATEDPKVVVIVEWADVVQHVLPEKRLRVSITQTAIDTRQLHFDCVPELDYLLQAVRN